MGGLSEEELLGGPTGSELPPDVRGVNPFMTPRTGDEANKQKEEEMTEEEIAEQRTQNQAYLKGSI